MYRSLCIVIGCLSLTCSGLRLKEGTKAATIEEARVAQDAAANEYTLYEDDAYCGAMSYKAGYTYTLDECKSWCNDEAASGAGCDYLIWNTAVDDGSSSGWYECMKRVASCSLIAMPQYSSAAGMMVYQRTTVLTVVGDPHATNLAGEKFNILALGEFEFIRFPRHATEEELLLSIRGTIKRLGSHCKKDWAKNPDSFIRDLTLSGSWLKDQNGKIEIRAVDGEAGQALQIRNEAPGTHDEAWTPAGTAKGPGFGTLFNLKSAKELHMRVGPPNSDVKLRIFMKSGKGQGAEGPVEAHYLNLGIKGLDKLKALGELGGILGMDDHGASLVPPSDCPAGSTARREPMLSYHSEEDWPSDALFVGGR